MKPEGLFGGKEVPVRVVVRAAARNAAGIKRLRQACLKYDLESDMLTVLQVKCAEALREAYYAAEALELGLREFNRGVEIDRV